MNTVSFFPSKIPEPGQLEIPRVMLFSLLHNLTKELMLRQGDLLKVDNAAEFAAVVRKTADKLAEASDSLTAMAQTVRDSWGAECSLMDFGFAWFFKVSGAISYTVCMGTE